MRREPMLAAADGGRMICATWESYREWERFSSVELLRWRCPFGAVKERRAATNGGSVEEMFCTERTRLKS